MNLKNSNRGVISSDKGLGRRLLTAALGCVLATGTSMTLFASTAGASVTSPVQTISYSSSSPFSTPNGVVVDSSGDMFVSNYDAGTITVTATTTTTIFGQSVTADTPVTLDPSGGQIETDCPHGLALDASGDLFIADKCDDTIIVVPATTTTIFGQSVTADTPVTLEPAGGSIDLQRPHDLAFDSSGDLFIANRNGGDIIVVPNDTTTSIFGEAVTPDTPAALIPMGGDIPVDAPHGIAFDSAGDLFITDEDQSDVVVVPSADGTIFGQTVSANTPVVLNPSGGSTNLNDPHGIAVDSAGNLYISDGYNAVVVVPNDTTTSIFGQSVTGDTPVVLDSGTLTPSDPEGITLDGSGNLYVVDADNNSIWSVTATNTTLFSQSITKDTPSTLSFSPFSGWNYPYGFAVDSAGDVFVANSGNNSVAVVAASTGTLFGQSVTANTPIDLHPSGGALSVTDPQDVVLDSAGDLFVVSYNGSIVVVPAAGTTTIFGQTVTPDTPAVLDPSGFTGPTALNEPQMIAFDAAGNLYISNYAASNVLVDPVSTGTLFGQSVTADTPAVFTPSGGSLPGAPGGIAFDSSGNMYEVNYANSSVTVVPVSTGTLFGQSVVANTPATLSATTGLEYPWGVAVDSSGDLFIGTGQNYSGVDVLSSTSKVIYGQLVQANTATSLAGVKEAVENPSYLQFDSSGKLDIGGSSGLYQMSGPIVSSLGTPVTFTVNDTTDAALANPSGTSCVSTHGGTCTLRAAVQAADNSNATATISLPAGTYTLSIPSTGSNDPSTGDLDVNGFGITITGAGAGSTFINANGIDRAFAVQVTSSLSISGVTIERGAQSHTSPSYNSTDNNFGGAIYNDGTLTVTNSIFSDNSAYYDGGTVYSDSDASSTSITNSTITGSTSGDDDGGAIFVRAGSLTLTGDTINHNTSDGEGGAIYEGGSGALTISGSTISNNVADSDGGAIYDDGSGAFTITNSTFSTNSTGNDSGGAIFSADAAAMTISGSTFSNDTSGDSSGGAIYDDSGPLNVTSSAFTNDTAGSEYGGAIYMDYEDLTVSGSTFTGDEGSSAGAIYVNGTGATAVQSITTSTFSGNTATDEYGGAIYHESGDLQISSSTFTGNDSSYYGGALYEVSRDGLQLTNDTFDGNQAVQGGAIDLETSLSVPGTISLLNDTIARNSAYYGGGIYDPSKATSIQNTIVADNSGGITVHGGGDCFTSSGQATDAAGSSDVGGNIDSDSTCFSISTTGDAVGVDPLLAPLAQNGGSVQTDALYSSSPAVGLGISSPSACPSTDAEGLARTGACDSGAYQASTLSAAPSSSRSALPSSATFTVNDSTDAALAASNGTTCVSTNGGSCTLRAAIQAADNLGSSVTIALSSGTYVLSIPSTGTNDPSTGDLDVTNNASITLVGQGAGNTVINANGIDRAFAVQPGSSLSISGVTIERGAQSSTNPSSYSTAAKYGGAIYNDGTLAVSNSTFSDNSAYWYGGAVYADSDAISTSITNSTITGGTVGDGYGGAVYVDAGSLTLTGDTISHNATYGDGGAIYEDGSGTLTVSGSTISSNVAYGHGGAIADYGDGALTITNSTINGNASDESEGGAIYDEDGATIMVSGSTISNDSSGDADGGAIYDEYGPLTVTNSTFANDIAGDGAGGAIYMDEADLTVSGSNFTGSQGWGGGAIYVYGSSSSALQSITTSTFSGNEVTDDEGGAIYDSSGNLQISSSTFTGNNASYYGGALYYDSSNGLGLTNDTFDGNQAADGGAIYLDTDAGTGTIVFLNDTIARNSGYYGGGISNPSYADTIENSVVADNAGGVTSHGGGDCYWNASSADVGGNIDSDGTCFSSNTQGDVVSANPLLAPLAFNSSTSLETDALQSGSPAIGAGVSTPLACPTKDAIGSSRGSTCDSGALQYVAQVTQPTNPPPPVSTKVPSSAFGTPTSATSYNPLLPLTFSDTYGGATETLTVPAGALPTGTTVSIYPVVSTATLQAQVPTGSSYVLSFGVTWLSQDGKSPVATTPITMTITDPNIVAGDTIYQVTSSGVVAVGTATVNGTVTITFVNDPTFLVTHKALVAGSALTVTSTSGTVGSALSLTTSGGSGTGALSYTVTNGTATGCTLVGSTLNASSAGTCLVTATKAADSTYAAVSSSATPVTFVALVATTLHATKVNGSAMVGKTVTLTITGTGFTGAPTVTSNESGTTAFAAHDNGKLLTVKVTVAAGSKTGHYTFTIRLVNGKSCRVGYTVA